MQRDKHIPEITDAEEAAIQRGIASDPDNPEITDAEWETAKPFAEAFPDLHAAIKRGRGRPRVPNPMQAVTLRLPPETVDRYKAGGGDWRKRMADAVKNH